MIDVSFICRTFGLTQVELARALRVAPFSVSRWVNGYDPKGLNRDILLALHATALRLKDDEAGAKRIGALLGLGIGSLIFRLLTKGES